MTRMNDEDLTTITVRHTVRDARAIVKLYPIVQEMVSDLRILSNWFKDLRCTQLTFEELQVGDSFDEVREENCDDSVRIDSPDLFNQALIEDLDACLSCPDPTIVAHFHDNSQLPLVLSVHGLLNVFE